MSGIIPFARESWVAVNLYSLQTDGRQTLTLDGEPPPNYTPGHTIAYLDKWEHGSEDLGLGGTFYCIKSNHSAPPDMITTLLNALNARGTGRWLRVVRRPVSEHTLVLWDAKGRLRNEAPYQCTCGTGVTADLRSVRCESGAEIFEAT